MNEGIDCNDDVQLPETLQNFLSGVGVVNHSSQNSSGRSTHLIRMVSAGIDGFDHNNGDTNNDTILDEDIFESAIDLSEERLRFVFNMFDTDEDGLISYEKLRQGLEVQSRCSLELDEQTFQVFVSHLDPDKSGDISYEEFSEGIRLLMLRALLHPNLDLPQMSELEVFDYDNNRLQRSIVNDGCTQEASAKQDQNPQTDMPRKIITRSDFFYNRRSSWVKTRWVNVIPKSDEASTLTMKRLAVYYALHPLAVEDALQDESRQRAKVEVYSNHYHIMVPVLTLGTSVPHKRRASKTNSTTNCFQSVYQFICCQFHWPNRGRPTESRSQRRSLSTLRIESTIVNIFVNVPQNNTLITFSRDVEKKHCWTRVQRELQKSYSKLRQYDAQYLTYALLDQVVDLVRPITNAFRKELMKEMEYLQKVHFNDTLEKVHRMRRELEKVARKIKPLQSVVTHAIEDEAISPGATVYLRDVRDNLKQEDEEIRHLIVECQNLDAESDKVKSHQMDRTLYTLTVVSAVFLPAQFLTGVWGMNFEYMPELDDKWFYPGFFWAFTAFIMLALLVVLNFGRAGHSSWNE